MILGSCLATPVFAAQPRYLSVPGSETSTQNSEIVGTIISQNKQIDYASIVEKLDINELDNFVQAEKSRNPEDSEQILEQKLKAKILQEGLDKKIIFINNNGHITFNQDISNQSSPYSYGDLPIINNKLGDNEKRVFNKSLVKGLNVLTSAQTSMSYYKSYYNSTSNYEDDNADAFRHSLWMALSAHKTGVPYAIEFGMAHEVDFPSSDLYNNNAGATIASKIPGNAPNETAEELALEFVNDAVKNGVMRRFKGSDIGTKTFLVNTNAVGSKKE